MLCWLRYQAAEAKKIIPSDSDMLLGSDHVASLQLTLPQGMDFVIRNSYGVVDEGDNVRKSMSLSGR